MNRYRPEPPPRSLAGLAAAALTAAMLAGVHAEATPARGTFIPAVFTGEVTAHGPVYRLPRVRVDGYRVFELALPDLIDRAFGERRSEAEDAAPPHA